MTELEFQLETHTLKLELLYFEMCKAMHDGNTVRASAIMQRMEEQIKAFKVVHKIVTMQLCIEERTQHWIKAG